MVTNMLQDTMPSLSKPEAFLDTKLIQRILLKLLGTKEEIAIAKEIEKATESNPFSLPLLSSQVFNGQRPQPELVHMSSPVTLVA